VTWTTGVATSDQSICASFSASARTIASNALEEPTPEGFYFIGTQSSLLVGIFFLPFIAFSLDTFLSFRGYNQRQALTS